MVITESVIDVRDIKRFPVFHWVMGTPGNLSYPLATVYCFILPDN